jgi:hypothetical protein
MTIDQPIRLPTSTKVASRRGPTRLHGPVCRATIRRGGATSNDGSLPMPLCSTRTNQVPKSARRTRGPGMMRTSERHTSSPFPKFIVRRSNGANFGSTGAPASRFHAALRFEILNELAAGDAGAPNRRHQPSHQTPTTTKLKAWSTWFPRPSPVTTEIEPFVMS